MRVFHLNKNRYYCPTVNVDRLWSLVPSEVRDKATGGKALVVDAVKAGYFKVGGYTETFMMGRLIKIFPLDYARELTEF